ncbi:hypothetical protein AZE42_07818 [Rhizopogon vesiculosus]|uniref:DUF6533 domain-containing protein n=1 Tax=Rhizopogon vesiculosus TaxID=180088 RepID=A0A1J8Q5R9_9AGAM|nr:hypothetical protein AZE42_07818 [Rhizopogon vesiculosus]
MPLSVQFAQDLWVRSAFAAAGHTFLIYDYFLTLNDEISYIWNSPWTVVKVLFLVNRYGNLVVQTYIRLEEAGLLAHNSESFCLSFALLTSYFLILSSASIHILVLMRASAIWGTRKRVTQILIMGYMGYVLMLIGWTTYGIHNKQGTRLACFLFILPFTKMVGH